MEGIDLTQVPAWFQNPAIFIPVIVSVVGMLRERIPAIDGRVAVGAATVAVGAVLGVVGQYAGFLSYEPFSGFTAPLGGLAYGALAGAGSFLGVNFFDLLAGRWGKRSAG